MIDPFEIKRAVSAGEMTPEEAVENAFQGQTGRVYVQKSKEDRVAQYRKSQETRRQILVNRIPFITKGFLPDFFLSQGLILVGAESGKAKSTTCANVLAGFLNTSKRPAIVVTNEEAPDSIYDRVSCILCRLSYNDYYSGKLTKTERGMVEDTSLALMDRVEVVDDGAWDMAYKEDVIAVCETAAKKDVGIVLVDYLQTITMSRVEPDKESFQISKDLGFYFKGYGKKYGVPVVVFAQLSGAGESKSMAERVQNDKTFYNHAFTAIEVTPDFKTLTTTFKVHKNRFGDHSGKEVSMEFRGGRYEFGGGI
jgi:predicted ATP-dependent serine protease